MGDDGLRLDKPLSVCISQTMGPNVLRHTILPVVSKHLPISPRLSSYEFLSRCYHVVVVVFTLKTRSDLYPVPSYFTLQGKETNFRGHKLTQNNKGKKYEDLKISSSEKQKTVAGAPKQEIRRFLSKP